MIDNPRKRNSKRERTFQSAGSWERATIGHSKDTCNTKQNDWIVGEWTGGTETLVVRVIPGKPQKSRWGKQQHVKDSLFSQVSDGSHIAQIICFKMKIPYHEWRQNVLHCIPWNFSGSSSLDSRSMCEFKSLRRLWRMVFVMHCCPHDQLQVLTTSLLG